MVMKVALLLTVLLSTLAGYVDVHVAEVQRPVLLLTSFACLLGALYPDGAWRRGVMLGLSIPLAHIIARVTGQTLPYTVDSLSATFLALAPALLGTYLGVGMRRLIAPAPRKEQPRP